LKNSPILILDEATSSLDSETEALIQEALSNLIKGRTVFVIAHRLSTIQNCDEIFVVENGQFVERGNHEELLRLGGRYARYYNIQFSSRPTVDVQALTAQVTAGRSGGNVRAEKPHASHPSHAVSPSLPLWV
jgi:ABC-type multidrug transport system ATPase subunit